MLRVMLVSLVWAICSTCLVRPWFWRGVKNKNLFDDDERIGFSSDWKKELRIQVGIFVEVFVVSVVIYAYYCCRYNLYGSFFLIELCCFFQLVWGNKGKCYTIIFTIMAVTAVLWVQDGIAVGSISVPLKEYSNIPLNTEVISQDEIQSLFKVNYVSELTYNNGKYIFTTAGGVNKGYSVVIIEKDNYTEVNFVPCNYYFHIGSLRSKYPTQKIKKLYVTVSDDNVPYGLFVVAKKDWILGTYNVNGYVMLNLITGEIQEYKQEEELPRFAVNN